MGWLSWIRRKPEPDYETLLAQLDSSIKTGESHLLSIKLRERRANALFVTYGLGLWVVYLALWWYGIVRSGDGAEKAIRALPIVGGPVLIVFTRRIMRAWFTRQKNSEEKSLLELKKQQREKVEELKRKTGYYSTRNLLEKYDEAIKKNPEARASGPVPPQSTASTPNRPRLAGAGTPQTGTPIRQFPGGPPQTPQQLQQLHLQQQQPAVAPTALPLLPPAASSPAPRSIFDKLADALLGVTGEEDSPNSKYALICAKCYAHNGLVPKEEFDTIQYQCPRCGHFNPRRKALPRPVDTLPTVGPTRRRVQDVREPSPALVHDDETSEEEDEKEDDAEAEEKVMTEKERPEDHLRQRRVRKADQMEVDQNT